MKQDDQYEVDATERCVPSMFCSLCGREVKCRDQSYAQFVANVIIMPQADHVFAF